MAKKAPIVIDLKYIGIGQWQKLKGILKYLEFRDGSLRMQTRKQGTTYRFRSWEEMTQLKDTIPAATVDPRTLERWVDRGLGHHYRAISQRCEELEGDKIHARLIVVSPDPELMQHLPHDQRLNVLAEVTEDVIRSYYEEQDWGDPEFSYVMHSRETNALSPEGLAQPVNEQLHSHVVTSGTHIGDFGRQVSQPKFLRAERLHQLSRDSFEHILGRELGIERFREIMAERELSDGSDVESPELPMKATDIDLGIG